MLINARTMLKLLVIEQRFPQRIELLLFTAIYRSLGQQDQRNQGESSTQGCPTVIQKPFGLSACALCRETQTNSTGSQDNEPREKVGCIGIAYGRSGSLGH